jgi:single-strand DNA-binding protein
MAKSVNKVILIGNVGKDPDIKYTPSGVPVAKVSLATNEKYKDKSGEWQERTEWHNLVFWQRLAEIVGEYVKKGSKVYIEGRLQTSSWEDKQSGEKKYRTEIVVGDLVLLGANGNGNGEHSRSTGTGDNRQEHGGARQELHHEPVEEAGITDEDIPF